MNTLRHVRVPALAVLLLPLPCLAQQASSPQDVAACASISTDQLRLACFDAAVAGQRSPSAIEQADAAAADGKQRIREEKAAGNDTGEHGGDLYAHDSARSALANAGRGSLLDSRWELAQDSKLGTFGLRAYKPVYLLPAFWTSKLNTTPTSPNPANTVTTPQPLDRIEAKFQISLKTKIAQDLFGDNGDLWVGYTQVSHWQVYNSDISRPFRETDYEPELLMVFRNSYHLLGWNGRMAAIGVVHQSNGRADPLSRSWNRVIANIGLDRENWALTIRPWYRINESAKDDNNPDIEDYMGRADATLVYKRGRQEFSLMGRHSLRGGDRSHGALQFDWAFPITSKLHGYVQIFDGYGESLIDYNHRATYVGAGVSLLEWF